jgi:AcrR family transcriptional regulator
MPKGFSNQEKERIRTRLIQEGTRLFTQYGLKKTSVDEAAAAAGISKGAFYLFFSSKEEFFMDVVESIEKKFREEILREVILPGPTPRLRLIGIFKKALHAWKTIPLLRQFNRSDYEILAGRVPVEKMQEHVREDGLFIQTLVEKCRINGIPVTAKPETIGGLMYVLFLMVLHENDFGIGQLTPSIDLMVELVAAHCLGEIPGPSITES